MQERNTLIFGSHIFLFSIIFVGVVGVLTWCSQRGSVAKERISFGEKSLISGKSSDKKKAGMKAIAEKNWQDAIEKLRESLTENHNDPEALIFLNNANVGTTASYTIAVSVPISKDPNGSLEILRGIAQAQSEFNSSKGESQRRLKVAIASDDNDPEVTKQVATALVNDSNVLGVVGHYASGVTIAAKDIYTSNELVAITPISTSVDLTKNSDSSKNSKPYIFRTVPSDSDTAQALKIYMSQNLNKNNNVAIFYNSDSNYSKSLACEFRNALVDAKEQECDFKNFDLNAKGQVRKINGYDLYEQKFNATSSVKQAIDKGTQVLMLAADTSTLPKALDVVRAAKGKNLNILAGDDVYTPDTLKVGDAAAGMVVTAFWHIDNNSESNFVKKSKELWGESAEVNWRTALAYDATQALIKAIQLQGNPNRSGVQQTLLSKDFKATGASDDIEFLPSGDRKDAKVVLVKIVSTNNSSTPYKFVPVAADRDKPSGDYSSSPTNNNSSPTPTSSPLSTSTPTLTSTPTPSSSTTSPESDSVCRLQSGLYEAYVNQTQGLNLRKEAKQSSKLLRTLNYREIVIILKKNEDKTWENICVKSTKLEGWVKANNTKKVVK
ncbi:MAG: receptor ligand binding family protein [Hapalosiphonaceae cyanobacterium JJU2]|nr:MAG: receptor ligand binding family protein [Hapalosiphonaceae cyanobacterium JJU2]